MKPKETAIVIWTEGPGTLGGFMASNQGLDRLLETERRAAALVAEARRIADLRVATARETSEFAKRDALAVEALRLEAAAAASGKAVDAEVAASLDAYRQELASLPRDVDAFRRECRQYLDVEGGT
jgi:phage host-nuclease inhibitor protein Gam